MKLIFLDIDGVLNCVETKVKSPSGCIGIDETMCKRLKQIVEQTDAKIVLTSTWKTEWNKTSENGLQTTKDGNYLVNTFNKYGLTIFDKTYEKTWAQRGEGVLNFLDNHKDIESFVILDDEFTVDYIKHDLDKYHVKTYYTKHSKETLLGLQDYHVEKAVCILNGR